MNLTDILKNEIRDIPDFPKEGIIFKDITPILLKPAICEQIVDHILNEIKQPFDCIVGIESRGFLLGMPIAIKAKVPFVPARKKGKLPGETESYSYTLEYGEATLEIHKGHIKKGAKVLIHDDLLATGGTALATSKIVQKLGAEVVGFSFLVQLSFLNGVDTLKNVSSNFYKIIEY